MKLFDELNWEGLFSKEEIFLVEKIIMVTRATNNLLKLEDPNDLLDICLTELYWKRIKYKTLKKTMVITITKNNLEDISKHRRTNKERANYDKNSLDEEIINKKTGEIYSYKDIISDGTNLEEKVLSKADFDLRMKKLTEFQRRICGLTGEGYTQKEIGNILDKSERTIKREMKKIRIKFAEK